MSIPSFNKIHTLGHREVRNILDGPVEITEKVDGSQFGFGAINGELFYRSKGQELKVGAVPENHMFKTACSYVEDMYMRGLIPNDHIFYCEYLQRPRHNVLKYDRVPLNNLALYAVHRLEPYSHFVSEYNSLLEYASLLGIDCVPLIHRGMTTPEEILKMVSETDSKFGGCKVEGVVIKNYNLEQVHGAILYPISCAKFVGEAFKEVFHGKRSTPKVSQNQRWEDFKQAHATEARWQKAVQTLRESGMLAGDPRDIGPLRIAVMDDIVAECGEDIANFLWETFGKDLLKESVARLPIWYKEQLALAAFDSTKCEYSSDPFFTVE